MKKNKAGKRWTALLLALCLSVLGMSGLAMDASAAAKAAITSLKLSADGRNITKRTLGMGGAPGADSEDYQSVLSQKIPVIFYFGDYIDNGDPQIAATGMWQMMRQACYSFTESYTAAGGNSTVVDLPKIGITGNDHFMFQDLNNDVIADHIENRIRGNVNQM